MRSLLLDGDRGLAYDWLIVVDNCFGVKFEMRVFEEAMTALSLLTLL